MDRRVIRVIRRINAALQRDVTVAQLAATVNLSSSRFTSLFKNHVGMPPARYLRTLRLERARGLLEQTSLSVREVMAHVGISDPSHFTRDFRRHYGFAPTELRRRLIADEEHEKGTRLAPAEKEEGSMNWDQIEGSWKQVKGKAKEQWGRLTDDELDQAAGRRDQLVGKVQERYGYARDQAEREVDEAARHW
jgi:AraC-like DNA-binding protein/uncharacterized protein YjbJ (UPF0337 family)